MHDAAMAVIVVDRVMQGAAIIPDRDRTRRPGETAGEFQLLLVLEQIGEEAGTLLLRC